MFFKMFSILGLFGNGNKKNTDPILDPNAVLVPEEICEEFTSEEDKYRTKKKCKGPIFKSKEFNVKFCGKCHHIKPPP